ncbi:MAG: ABC transporter ATP-binding protein [Gemmatimonadetes bacterium]|nr:ABC transporter ATP-binding protein [Gemmatimonadota bacterium]
MIAFEGVRIAWAGAGRDAVRDVSFEARRGAMTAIAGPNGAGKSTLVRALLGRAALAAGRILVDGADRVALDAPAVARRVAVVTQREEPAFPLAVREYVALGRFPHQTLWRRDVGADARAVAAAIDRAGIGDLVERRTDTLSGGEWQRVRVARALAQEADALVLDEPTAFLDIAHEMALFELLHAIAAGGQAVLLVSHQLNLVARFADHLVLLHEGLVAAAGDPGMVMDAGTLERVYGWPVVVTRDPAVGAPTLVPLRGGRRSAT